MKIEDLKKLANGWTLIILLFLFFGNGAAMFIAILKSPIHRTKGEVVNVDLVNYTRTDSFLVVQLKDDVRYFMIDQEFHQEYPSIVDGLPLGEMAIVVFSDLSYVTDKIVKVEGEIRTKGTVVFSADEHKKKMGFIIALLIITEAILGLLVLCGIFIWLMT